MFQYAAVLVVVFIVDLAISISLFVYKGKVRARQHEFIFAQIKHAYFLSTKYRQIAK